MSRPIRSCPLAALIALSLAPDLASAAGFVYERRLDDGGAPANGRHDLKLSPYADAKSGAALGAPIVFEDVPVVDGRFRVDFDLPLVSAASAWIEVGVREAHIGFVAEEIAAIDPRLVTRNAAGEIEGVKYERLTAVLAGEVQELAQAMAARDAAHLALRERQARLEAQVAALVAASAARDGGAVAR